MNEERTNYVDGDEGQYDGESGRSGAGTIAAILWDIVKALSFVVLISIIAGFFAAVFMTFLLDGGKQYGLRERGFKIGVRGTQYFNLDEAAGNSVRRSCLYGEIDDRLRTLESLVLGKQEYEMVNATIADSGRYIGDGMHIPDYIGQLEELAKAQSLREELNLAERVQRLESMYLNMARQSIRRKNEGGDGEVRRTAPKRVPFRIPKEAVK